MPGTVALLAPPSHRASAAARRALIEAHAGDRHLAALLGPPGIGKTFLLTELERHFRAASYEVERVAHGDLLSGEETAHILLVDEADRLDEAALQALATRGRGLVVLAALPGFAARLEPADVATVRLGPLEPGEVAGYVANRLAATGLPADRFGADALPALAAASGGVPRLLNTLMGNSAFTADMEGESRVTARHVEAAAALRADVAPLPPTAAPAPREAARPPDGTATSPRAAGPAPDAAGPAPGAATAFSATAPVVPPTAPPRRRRGLPWLGAGLAAVALAVGAAAWWPELRPAGGGTTPADAATQAAGPLPPAAPVPPAQRTADVLRQALSTAAMPPVPTPPPPAPATPPSPTALLPSAPLPRVVLTYPRRDAQAGERAAALAATLTHAGWLVGSPFPVSRTPAAPALRYFFQEDREAALSVAALAGAESGPPQLGSIPPGTPLPRPGTIELALAAGPAPAIRAAAAAPMAPEPQLEPAPPAPKPLAPADRGSVAAGGLQLRWSVPGGAQPGCCYVEVMTLPGRGEPAGPPREVFAGYGERPDSQPLALTETRPYAWRVITVSRDGLRYAAGPWSSFTLGRDAP